MSELWIKAIYFVLKGEHRHPNFSLKILQGPRLAIEHIQGLDSTAATEAPGVGGVNRWKQLR